jgi:23S rRNA pseudouridine1911/1915/1917 synthase
VPEERFPISAQDAGKRADRYLTEQFSTQSRAAIQKWFDAGVISINGRPIKPAHRLKEGECMELVVPRDQRETAKLLQPWKYPLEIVYEDDAFVAVNKPPHMIVHPGAGVAQHTLVHAALYHWPEIEAVGHPARPGIVHRLDKETSGLLLLAKTQDCYLKFVSMFKQRSIQKHYRAAVFGKMDSMHGQIEKALGRDPVNRKKISVRARSSRAAVTLYRVLEQYSFGAFLDVQILTGRTHQIRVHLSSENHPIIGDTKYGGANWNRIADVELRTKLKQGAFFGLHAFSLDFEHPVSGKQMHLETKLPEAWNYFRDRY